MTVLGSTDSWQPVNKNRYRMLNKQILAGPSIFLAIDAIPSIQGFPIKDLDFYVNLVLMSIERRFQWFVEKGHMSFRVSFLLKVLLRRIIANQIFPEAQGGYGCINIIC